MGGRVRVMLSGGAPLSPDTHEQIKLCLCTIVAQGMYKNLLNHLC